MEKRNYNVVLQSEIGDGSTQINEMFFYDWSQLPDVPYIVTFSFSSSVITFATMNGLRFACLYMDLGQSYNQIATSKTAPTSLTSIFLGNILYNTSTVANLLTAESDSNPPTFLNGRPKNNNFTVDIRNSPGASFALVGAYSLILSFQEV